MTYSNPAFKNRGRASYEFGFLLRSLPRHLHGTDLSRDQLNEVEAADRHAGNCGDTLLDGLQSLGRILWSAGTNEDFPPEPSDFARIGLLVTEVATQIEFMAAFQDEVAENNLRIAQKGSSK
jgi:hypothetical protein